MRPAALGIGLLLTIVVAPAAEAQATARDSAVAFAREADSELRVAVSLRYDSFVRMTFGRLERVVDRLGMELAPLDPPDSVLPARSTLDRLAREGDLEGRPLMALAVADSASELPGAVRWVLSARDVTEHLDEILAWVDSMPRDESLKHETRIAVLRHLATYAPEEAWRRAVDLHPEDRARVGVSTLHSESTPPALVDSVARVVQSDLDELPQGSSRVGLEAELARECGRRHVPFCMRENDPLGATDLIDDISAGDWETVRDRRAELAARLPADSLRQLEAYGLRGARVRCHWRSCDVGRLDSVFRTWIPGIEAAERRATGIAADQWRRRIASLWGARDPVRAREFVERIEDSGERAGAAAEVYREARPVAPLAAIELYLDLTPPDAAMGPDPYLLALRLGRADLAEAVFARIRPAGRFGARLRWAEALYRGGRWAEARDLAAGAVAKMELPPEARIDLTERQAMLLRRAGLVDDYLAKVRAAPDPVTRAAGLTALIGGFVETPRRGGMIR